MRTRLSRLELSLLIVGLLCLVPVLSNQMDPHLYPKTGPFFEGWYVRIIDKGEHASYGFLFGLVLPAESSIRTEELKKTWPVGGGDPLLCASLLLSPSKYPKLESPTACFDSKNYTVLKNGEPVSYNPDDKTPPNFEARLGKNISFIVTPTGVNFSVTIGQYRLEGETTSPVPWGPNGAGPESWLEHLPLPVHWFVYSLRSTVKRYSFTDGNIDVTLRGGSASAGSSPPVLAHMEKNWGPTFPKSWIWVEGVDPTTNVSFSISSGLLHEYPIDIPAQLSGYRNPAKGISCSFNPTNSLHTLHHDGCAGTAELSVHSVACQATFKISAQPSSFSGCLVTPQAHGFVPGCVESYQAVAEVIVSHTTGGQVVKDQQKIPIAALEFGGTFMCKEHCPSDFASD